MNISNTYQQFLLRVSVPTQPAAIPARIEFKASSLFLSHRSEHLTALSTKVDALKNAIIDRYQGVKDFLSWLKPLVNDRKDLRSCRIELIISPYFTCLSTCFNVSGIQPFGCLQNLVFASIFLALFFQYIRLLILCQENNLISIPEACQYSGNKQKRINQADIIIIQQRIMLKKQGKKGQGSDDLEKPWECQTCTFKNHPKILVCQMCSTQKRRDQQKEQKIDLETIKKSGFACHSCEHELDALKSQCPNCGEILIPDQDQQKTQKKKPGDKKDSNLLKCLGCGQQNDPLNQICVFCEQNLGQEPPSAIFPIKKRAPRKPRAYHGVRATIKTCRYCHVYVHGVSLQDHEAACTHISGEQLQIKYISIEKQQCMFCYQKLKAQEYEGHEKTCSGRKQFYAEDSPTYQRTTKLQKDTMIYMHKKCQKLHWIARQALLKKIISLGFKANELQNLHHYIVNYAPIIIHMHVNSHMQFFVKDTHYRNQFQTKKSSGSLSQTSRISWQDRMFDKMHHNASPFQRVKYGTINFTNDPRGVKACVGYGQSYFLLKPHVRNRCTVTDMDSSSPSATIATFQFCYHLFNKLPDAQLRAAFEGSKANEVQSNVIGAYKQIQIHGPIEFKKDIERVYVNKAELADPKHLDMIKEFCKKNDLEYEIFEQPAPKVHPAPFGAFGGFSGGLFGYSAPATSHFGSFGFPAPVYSPPPSLFSAPRMSPSTTHLFGGGVVRRYPPATGLLPPPSAPAQQKQPQQGVDYI